MLDASVSGETTTGCRCSYRSTCKNVRASAECAWCQGGRKLSNSKLAWPKGARAALRKCEQAHRSISRASRRTLRVGRGVTSQLTDEQDDVLVAGVWPAFASKLLNR